MAKGEKRISRLERKPKSDRRTIRLQKQKDKTSGEFTRREIKERKTGRKAAATLTEAKHQGTLGTKQGIRKMTRLGEKYNRIVSKPSFSMTPGSREKISPGITRADDKTNAFHTGWQDPTIRALHFADAQKKQEEEGGGSIDEWVNR